MSELTLTVIRLGFLAVLWAFVLTVAGVMRTDLFGQRVSRSAPAPAAKPARKAARPPKEPRSPKQRNVPRQLVVVEGSLSGTTLSLGTSTITVGRAADSTLVLDDQYASNHHARLFLHEGAWVVEDLGSTNGTYLGRTRLSTPTVVPVGMPIRIGKTVFELRR